MKLLESFEKMDRQFDNLCVNVSKCQACERMCESQRVLNRSAGSLNADVMFIGEAPGRLGADGSGIPFHGDKAGHNFENLLHFASIDRASIFVTNAVLCNPKDENGNNATPVGLEIKNCVSHLEAQINIINPKIVITLGSVALKSTGLIEHHGLSLKENVRIATQWYKRILIPIYHPGQRAMLHRSFANQRSDYQFIADQLKKIYKGQKKASGKTKPDVTLVIDAMLSIKPIITYFALHKLFYLIENQFVKDYNQRLTNAYFVRQKDGPYCTDLHPAKLKKALNNVDSKLKNEVIIITKKSQLTLFEEPIEPQILAENAIDTIKNIMEKYGDYSHADLKRSVYLTAPIKHMLRLEKNNLVNLYNAPIDFFQ
jgi:uracil-DNA glycosylase family 4